MKIKRLLIGMLACSALVACTNDDVLENNELGNKEAMDALSIENADILGVSMGGMIAQHFAAKYPHLLGKLVLTVTSAEPNEILCSSINEWLDQAEKQDHKALMESNLRLIYSDRYYRNNRPLIPLLSLITKPKSYRRFKILARACLSHNAIDKLSEITAPCLIIGGGKDKALGFEASRKLAEIIPNANLHSYPDLGHGLYEEAKDFQRVVFNFLNEKSKP